MTKILTVAVHHCALAIAGAAFLVSGSAQAVTASDLPPELRPDYGEPITEQPMTDDAWVGINSVLGRPLAKSASTGLAFAKGDGFGNDSWGGGYSISASGNIRRVAALPGRDEFGRPCTVPIHVEDDFGLQFNTWARLFGQRVDALGLDAEIVPPIDYDNWSCMDDRVKRFGHSVPRGTEGQVGISLGGYHLFNRDFPLSTSVGNPFVIYQSSGNLFSASTTFSVGPVPITVSAAASYDASLTWNASTNSGLSVSAAVVPHAALVATASAGVGFPGFNAGVMGSLDIVNLSAPVSLSHGRTAQPCRTNISTDLSASLDVSSLNGTVSLYARGPTVVWNGYFWVTRLHTYKRNIASWSGVHQHIPLLDISGNTSSVDMCGSDDEYEY